MATSWHFKEFKPGDTLNDPISGALFSQETLTDHPASALVRESIQNSLDARRRSNEAVKVSYTLRTGYRAPRLAASAPLMAGLLEHLRAPDAGTPRDLDPRQPVPYLAVEDFGTTGLTGPQDQWDPKEEDLSPFFLFLRALGRSGKAGEQRGRWGIGKYVFPMASRFNSWFSLTVPADGRQPALIGRCVLKTHRTGTRTWHPDGYFGRRREDGLVLPVQPTDHEWGEFRRTFGLSRNTEPGLSVVVPWLREDVTTQAIVEGVVSEYFLPIIRDQLQVTINDGLSEVTIDALTIDTYLESIRNPVLTDMVALARQAASCKPAQRLTTRSADGDGSPRFTSDLLTEDQLETLRRQLAQGDMIAVRMPFAVRPRNGPERHSHFDVYIRESEAQSLGYPLLVGVCVIVCRSGRPVLASS